MADAKNNVNDDKQIITSVNATTIINGNIIRQNLLFEKRSTPNAVNNSKGLEIKATNTAEKVSMLGWAAR